LATSLFVEPIQLSTAAIRVTVVITSLFTNHVTVASDPVNICGRWVGLSKV